MATAVSSGSGVATSSTILSLVKSAISDRLRAINIDMAIRESITEHQNEIADLNTEQLNRGIKADGSSTGDYANIGYKGRLRPVDLYDTGDFHKSGHVEVFEKAFEMVFDDPKTDMLKDKYGDEIEGLTKENISEASQIIKETMIDNVRKQL